MPSGSRPFAGSSRMIVAGSPSSVAGEAEALLHAERVAAQLAAGDLGHADQFEHLVDATERDAVARREPPEMVPAGTGRVDVAGVEQDADLVQRGRELRYRLPAEDAHRRCS